jgi:hypothetical protein
VSYNSLSLFKTSCQNSQCDCKDNSSQNVLLRRELRRPPGTAEPVGCSRSRSGAATGLRLPPLPAPTTPIRYVQTRFAFYRSGFPAASFKLKQQTLPGRCTCFSKVQRILRSRLAYAAVFTNLGLTPQCVCICSSGVISSCCRISRQHKTLHHRYTCLWLRANPAILRRRSSTTAVRQSAAVRLSHAAATVQSRGLSTWWSASATSQYGMGVSGAKHTSGGDVLSRRSR